MDPSVGDLVLVRAHEHKLLEAVDVLEQVRERLLFAAADARDSSGALRRQAAQAERRSERMLADAARLIASAERLVADAKALQGESTAVALWHKGSREAP